MSQSEQNLNGIRTAFLTLGCKVNSYETQAMIQSFREAGAEIVSFDEGADIYIVNTCTVTGIADRKSRQMLHRAKKMNPKALVVAAGCYAQEAGNSLLEDSAVDVVIGNNHKGEAAAIVAEALKGGSNGEIEELAKNIGYEKLKINEVNEKTRAYIKIQDGCNQFCSYCIIPYVRGRIRSREEDDILQEVNCLAAAGYREIVLTGIHLSSYGAERNQEGAPAGKHFDGTALAKLILQLNEIEELQRIRLGSLEPRIITEEFVNTLAKAEKLCPHFHLSLQSGCDETLRRMNRKYNTKEYEEACQILKKAFRLPAVTTDVIVGFPGETQEEFDETCRFLERIQFAQMHIFRYSVRKGTQAEHFSNQVPEQIKAERSEQLLELDRRMRADYLKQFIGEQEEILTEDLEIKNGIQYRTGHSKRYVKFYTKEEVLENSLFTGTVGVFADETALFLK